MTTGEHVPIKYHDSLRDLMVPIDQVHQHPRNPNQGDPDAIAESIMAHGFFNPLVVQRSTGYILAGNHRYVALLSLGQRVAPVVWADVDDEQALRILIADNRTSEIAVRDSHELEALLKTLSETEAGLAGTAYDEDAFLELQTLNRAYNHMGIGDSGGNDDDYEPDYTHAKVLVTGKYDDEGALHEFTHEDVEEYVAQIKSHGFNAIAIGGDDV